MSQLVFSATKLTQLKIEGKLTPDADGYYELVLGGLEVHNNSGNWYYTIEGCRELFGPGSLFDRRIKNGCLRAEVNHPKRLPTDTDLQYANRMMDIDLNNVCAHIREVWLDFDYGKNRPELNNPNLIAIMGKVRPSGVKGDVLKDALDNKWENVCFSIRAIAGEYMVRGKRVRVLSDIIAIDFVNEGGITVASKWDSPATESVDNSLVITQNILSRISKETENCFATESSREVASYILEKHVKSEKPPTYAHW
jgi:hypothetical protein